MGGGYVNLQMAEGVNQAKASYGENYEELVKIKQKYDPQYFFHVNHNIAPNVS
jgi:Berberine and berberine like